MTSLLDQLPESPRVTEIVMDFERAMWNGVSATLQDVKILYCSFHWTQAVWRKTQELGLKPAYYVNDEGVHLYIKMLLSLPFLPANQIQPLFDNMTKMPIGKMCQLNYWICCSTYTSHGSPATFGRHQRSDKA